jgi:hypothetical protein
MSKYPILQPWIYSPRDDYDGKAQCYSIRFPDPWAKCVEQLGEAVARIKKWDNPWLPYHSLSALLLLTMPALISDGFEQVRLQDRPDPVRRLLADSDLSDQAEILALMVRSWVHCQYERHITPGTVFSAEARTILQDTLDTIEARDLQVVPYPVDVRCPELDAQYSPANVLRSTYYKAIPAWLVSQLDGQWVTLGDYTCPLQRTQSLSGQPELMTWPPYLTEAGDYLSLVLEFSVFVWPGMQPLLPRILPRWHVRRWVAEPLRADDGFLRLPVQNSTVHLRTRVPWIDRAMLRDDLNPFTIAPIKRFKNKTSGRWEAGWTQWLPMMLEEVQANPLPDIDKLVERPLRISSGDSQLDQGLVLSAQIRQFLDQKKMVGTGFFPLDRVALGEQTQAWMAALGLRLWRSEVSSIWSKGLSRRQEAVSEIASGLSEAAGRTPQIEMQSWFLDPATASWHWRFIQEFFGLSYTGDDDAIFQGEVVAHTAAGLALRFMAIPNPYPCLEPGQPEAALLEALRRRMGSRTPDEKTAVLVELEKLKGNDAKSSLRRILAHLNIHTQFQNPVLSTGKRADEQRKSRARASVLDLRRQLGYIGDIDAALTQAVHKAEVAPIEPGTAFIGLCLVQRNKPRRRIPLAMRLVTGSRVGQVCMPDREGRMIGEWMPYSSAWLEMGRRIDTSREMTDEKIIEWLCRFIGQVVADGRSTVLLAPVSKLRQVWPWLEYENLKFDRMEVGSHMYLPAGAPYERGAISAPHLRVLWYNADIEAEKAFYNTVTYAGGQLAPGYGHGVWKLADHHYVSIAPKSDSYQPNHLWTRIQGKGQRKAARMSQAIDVMPAFVQPGDSLDSLGIAFHVLRASASHWTQGFITDPLPNHLAELIAQDYLDLDIDYKSPGQN